MNTPILEVRELEVVFDGFRAIDGVDFTVNEGELRFLIGPNGAGKTTLVDVVTGLTEPAGGSVRFNGGQLDSVTGVGRRAHRDCASSTSCGSASGAHSRPRSSSNS